MMHADYNREIHDYIEFHRAAISETKKAGRYDFTDFVARVCNPVEIDGSDILDSPAVVEWEVTSRCNVHCSYCYVVACSASRCSDEMDTQEAFDFVKQMHECNVLAVRVEGGEPFIRDDLVDILCEMRRYRIGLFISTNGTLIDQTIAKSLANVLNPITDHIQVSLDGHCPEVQDPIVGKGSFDRAFRGLLSLSEAGIRLMVSMVVVEHNRKAIVPTYELIREIPCVEKFNVSPALTIGNLPGFPPNRKHELLPAFNEIHRIREKEGGPLVDARLGHAFHLDAYRKRMIELDTGRRETPHEKAGRAQVAVSASGDVFGDHHMIFPELCVGNVKKEHLLDIWNSGKWTKIRKGRSTNAECHVCNMRRLCSQRSMGIAYATYGTFERKDPNCIYDGGVMVFNVKSDQRNEQASCFPGLHRPVVIIFPPIWSNLTIPYLSLPSLGAYLRLHGFQVKLFDLNARFVRILFTEEIGERLGDGGSLSPKDLGRRLCKFAQKYGGTSDMDAYRATMFLGGVQSVETRLADLIEKVSKSGQYAFRTLIESAVKNEIAPLDCLVVGISIVCESQVLFALALAKIMREVLGQNVKVVLGGPWCTLTAPIIQKRPELFDLVDAIVVGEGETPLLHYCRAVINGEDIAAVPSLLYRHNKHVRVTEPAAPIDMATVPAPAFDLLDLSAYAEDKQEFHLPLQASRGCYYGRCRFCNYIRLNTSYRTKPARLMAQEMSFLSMRYNTSSFVFTDDVMAPSYLRQLAEHILNEGLSVRWTALTRIGPELNRELLTLLRSAGCWKMFFGIESGSQHTLDTICKGITLDMGRRVIDNTYAAGIIPAANFMVGIPGETVDDIKMTMSFAKSLPIAKNNLTILEFVLGRGSMYWNEMREIIADEKYREVLENNDLLLNFSFPRTSEIAKEVSWCIQ